MKMINDLLTQASTVKEVILTANGLANAQFEYNLANIFQRKAGTQNIKTEIENFRKVINSSLLEKSKKNELIALSSFDLCSFASNLTVAFMKREIKILE